MVLTYHWILTSTFKNIDFTTCGPSTVDRILWHHPDGRPESASTWVFCTNFDPAIFLMEFWCDFSGSVVSVGILFTQWGQFEVSIFDAYIYVSVSVILDLNYECRIYIVWIFFLFGYLEFVILRIWSNMYMPVVQVIEIIKKCWILGVGRTDQSSGCAFSCSILKSFIFTLNFWSLFSNITWVSFSTSNVNLVRSNRLKYAAVGPIHMSMAAFHINIIQN